MNTGMWIFAVLLASGVLIFVLALKGGQSGVVDAGWLGAVVLGAPLIVIGAIGFLISWMTA